MRAYYHYTHREEFAAGMWRTVPISEREAYIEGAAALMRDVAAFEAAMARAPNEWPKSCHQNLSTPSLNRQAWMGHAGCCLALESPEELTRLGWHRLTDDEKDAANAAADRVLARWDARPAIAQESLFDA